MLEPAIIKLPVHTIEVSHNGENMVPYDVFKVFQQFGEIQYVCRWLHLRIEIVLSSEAKNRLEKSPIIIDNQEYTVDIHLNPYNGILRRDRTIGGINDSLLHPPDQQSPLNITNALNDDCLMEIFERLDLLDLLAVANVCKRFNRIAVDVFQSIYAHKEFCCKDLNDGHDYGSNITLCLIEQCLRTFGPAKVQLDQGSLYNAGIYLRMVVEHCPNLKVLKLLGEIAEPSTLTSLRLIFPKLKKLQTAADDIMNAELNDTEWKIEELHLNGKSDQSYMPNFKMPKLTKLTIDGYTNLDGLSLSEFLAKNARIEHICLNNCRLNMSQINPIRDLPYLEELFMHSIKFKDTSNEVKDARNTFKTLKFCKLSGYSEDIDKILGLLVGSPIECLDLDFDDENQIDYICQMPSITSLNLRLRSEQKITDADLMKLSRSLNHLQELSIDRCAATLNGIVRVLRSSNELTKLNIGVCFENRIDVKDYDAIKALIAVRADLDVKIKVNGVCEKFKTMLLQNDDCFTFEIYCEGCDLCFNDHEDDADPDDFIHRLLFYNFQRSIYDPNYGYYSDDSNSD